MKPVYHHVAWRRCHRSLSAPQYICRGVSAYSVSPAAFSLRADLLLDDGELYVPDPEEG